MSPLSRFLCLESEYNKLYLEYLYCTKKDKEEKKPYIEIWKQNFNENCTDTIKATW